MSRSDVSDLEWQFIKSVFPNKSRGVKRVDDRRVDATAAVRRGKPVWGWFGG